jgi:lipid-A-disaccharide synthase
VIGENVVPEFMQATAAPGKLAPALRDVLEDTPQRRRQLDAFSRLDAIMATGGKPPSVQAAERASRRHRAGDAAEGAETRLRFAAGGR